jgi:non-heme chloroperoxidase
MVGGCSVTHIARRSFATSDGVTLSYLEAGTEYAGSATLSVAFIPGWSMPGWLWRKQLEELGRNYHTVALDPRGQGESEAPTFGYTAERRARDIYEFLAPMRKVLLVGWSLGAIESLEYLRLFGAERIAGLVLVDSSVGEEPAPPPSATFTQRLREDRDRMLGDFIGAIFAKPRSRAELDTLLHEAKRLSLEDSLALLSYPFERTHWRDIARAFEKPLLYVVTPQFEAQALNLKKNRPGTRVEVFRDAGHALFVDEPERFNSLIEDFAKRLSPYD